MRRSSRFLSALATAVALVAAGAAVTSLSSGHRVGVPAATAAAVSWAPQSTATIHPGVETFTNGAQCTANFVFTDGANVYLGQAAHCAGTGNDTQTNGCTSPVLPVGTPVTISGASKPGVLVYDSWDTMQAQHETNPDVCQYNDLALVQINPADVGRVNPTIPVWGGPDGLATSGAPSGSMVYSYGNSILRLGVTALSPKVGISEGSAGGGWSHTVFTVTPGIPGDSGSAFLDAHGDALGVLSTLGVSVPGGVVNNAGDLGLELAYLHTHTSFTSLQLVPGTAPFNPNAVLLNVSQPVDPNAVSNLQTFLGL